MNINAAHVFAQSGSRETPSAAAGRGTEILGLFSSAYARERREAMSLPEYLEGCRNDPTMMASVAERMITAIGEPTILDTSRDPRLGASSSTARSRSIPR